MGRDFAERAPAAGGEERDALLARLLSAFAEEIRRGDEPDVEGAARRHPELAEELRDLVAVARVADGAAMAKDGCLPAKAVPGNRETVSARGGVEPPGGAEVFPRRFAGHELLEELGRGGMGIVYRARELSLGRTVALKVLLGGSKDRASIEPVVAARLDHAGIVPVYQCGTEEGQPYFTMKLVEGTTLAARLAAGPIPSREAAAILLPVSRAIHFAHSRGILHRDLKPSNILMDRDGRAYVADFGLAKQLEGHPSVTRTGAILGTPRFQYFGPDRQNTWVTYPPYVWLPAVMVLAALAGHLIIFRALRIHGRLR